LSEAPPKLGTLYLVPVTLGGEDASSWLPPATLGAARALRTFIVEDAKSARHFLKSISHPEPLQGLALHLLNEHTKDEELDALLAPLLAGVNCGLMSEAGCPAVADPGAKLVRRAHAAGIPVEPLVGPSSILLALMASGMDGQHFEFHGYLPVDHAARAASLKKLDARSAQATQIFIETPYRNDALMAAILGHCHGDTLLCIAADLTFPSRFVATRTISEWKKKPPILDRRPAVFLLYRK
jgi:16S rRNA (cytidine1402-2'-O)-methyltransferase